ncbi:MAG: Flp family type IVb pilin [Alphaproteobacteria bacterium]
MLSLYIKAMLLKNKIVKDIKGATAIEYGLIAAGVAVAIIVIVFTLGDNIKGLFTGISDKVAEKTAEMSAEE